MGVSQSLRKVVERFGAGAEDEYDEFDGYEDDYYDPVDDERERLYEERHAARRPRDVAGADFDDIYDDEPRGRGPRYRSSYERSAPPLALVQPMRLEFGLVAPATFDEAQQIADRFRAEAPTIVNLQGCTPELAKRVTDFCSGLAYALEGSLQIVETGVILLAPRNVDVSGDATMGVRESGFYNQV